ncbi:MAG: hypothetical protein R2991_15725 [Thermoanaerobaculia bacterium]
MIRLEFQSFRDFAETAWPGLGRDGLWAPPGAPLPEGLGEVRLEVGLAEGSPLLRGVVRLEPEEETGRTFLRFVELDRPSRVLLERIESKLGHPVTVGPVREESAALPREQPGSAATPAPRDVAAPRRRPLRSALRRAEGIPKRSAPAEPAPGPEAAPSPVEAHTLEELADLLAGQERREALAQTQLVREVPRTEPAIPPPPGITEPAPLPPYLGGPDPEREGRRVLDVRSPWMWVAVLLAVLVAAWLAGRRLSGSFGVASREAVGEEGASARAVAAVGPFDRVERIEWASTATETAVTVRVNGAVGRERWETEPPETGAMRQVLVLHGVARKPEVDPGAIAGQRVVGLHTELSGEGSAGTLRLTIDLAGPSVHLTGVDVRTGALRLVFAGG